ncbi:Tox-REase-5 domain-containing protein [Aquimarina sp. 2304DJ70-9]|uniref:Tox-REase-5 domain-containing protein n=1 Tax=Aquimarina penaris TaxID=3231044 RepID=UPI0034623BB9
MKSIYKIWIIALVCLLSNNTFAQFQIAKSDDITKDTGNLLFDCSCTFPADYDRHHAILEQIQAEQFAVWLSTREVIFKQQIEERLNETFPNFAFAQIAWFNHITTDQRIDLMLKSRKSTYQGLNSQFNSAKRDLHYEREVTQYSLDFTTPSPSVFGDLKTNVGQGIKFTDLSSTAAQQHLNSIGVNLFTIEQGLNTQTKIINGIEELRKTPSFVREQIIKDYVAHYNSLNHLDKVKLMAKYLISSTLPGPTDLSLFWSIGPNRWPVNSDQYATFIDVWATQLGTSNPISYPSETNAEALKPYSLVSLGEERYSFINTKPELEKEIEDYFSNSRFKEDAFNIVKQITDRHLDNQAFNPAQGAFASIGREARFQNSTDKELGVSFGTGSALGFKGIGNILAELFDDSKVADLKLKGAIIRRMFGDNNMLFPTTLPDELVGRMFNFRKLPWQVKPTPGASDFFVQRVDIEFAWNMGAALWNNNMRIPEVYSSPSGVSAIEALIGPAIDLFDFEHLARVYNLSQSLQLNDAQENLLITNVNLAQSLNTFVSNTEVNGQIPVNVRDLARELASFATSNANNNLAQQFTNDVLTSLNTNSSFDFNPYLNSNALPSEVGPTSGLCPDPPCNISPDVELMYAYGPGLFSVASDQLYTILSRVFEYQNPDIVEGAAIRSILTKLRGIQVPDNISTSELGNLFQVIMVNGEFKITYEQGIGADLLNTGIGILDIMAILAPSRGGGAFLAARGGGIVTKEILAQYLRTIAKGEWIVTNESMSDAAKAYQEFISGRKWNESFKLNNVKFDALKDGVLGDAKSQMRNFVDSATGRFKPFFANSATGGQALIEQARRQINAAGGNPIEWHFEFEEVKRAVEFLFEDLNDINIILIHTPK